MLNFGDFIQVFVLTTYHHLKISILDKNAAKRMVFIYSNF